MVRSGPILKSAPLILIAAGSYSTLTGNASMPTTDNASNAGV
jgi:hypothetical protein